MRSSTRNHRSQSVLNCISLQVLLQSLTDFDKPRTRETEREIAEPRGDMDKSDGVKSPIQRPVAAPGVCAPAQQKFIRFSFHPGSEIRIQGDSPEQDIKWAQRRQQAVYSNQIIRMASE